MTEIDSRPTFGFDYAPAMRGLGEQYAAAGRSGGSRSERAQPSVGVAVMEVGNVGVGVLDGLVAVPVGVGSEGTGGLVVFVVLIVVAVLVLVFHDRMAVDVLVRGAK